MSGNLFLCSALLNPFWASSRWIAKACWSNSPLSGSTSLARLSSSSHPEIKLTSWPLESRWDVWPAMTNGIQRLRHCVSSELPLRGPYPLLFLYLRTMRCLLEQKNHRAESLIVPAQDLLEPVSPKHVRGPSYMRAEHLCEQIWMCGSGKDQKSCPVMAHRLKAIVLVISNHGLRDCLLVIHSNSYLIMTSMILLLKEGLLG